MKQNTKAFWLSYMATVVLSGITLVLLITFWDPIPDFEQQAGYTSDMTLSQAVGMKNGGETAVLFYCSLSDNAPRTFFLLTYDPDRGDIAVQSVDPSITGSWRGEKLPLAALHRLFGVRSVEAGAESALHTEIDATVYASRDALLQLLALMGDINIYLPKEMEYTEIYTGRKFALAAGDQTLSPNAAAGLLATLEAAGDMDGASMLITCLLQQHGQSAVLRGLVLDSIYGLCETNLTAVQTQLAEPVLRYVFTQEDPVRQGVSVYSGSL